MPFGFSTKAANGITSVDWLNDDMPVEDDTTFGEDIEITLKAGFYGMANNFIQIGNFFGSDAEEYDLYEEIGDLGNAYLDHQAGYDLAGELVTSLIPGGVGIQAVKLGKLGKLGSMVEKLFVFDRKLIATDKELQLAYKAVGSVDKGYDIRKLKRKAFMYSAADQAVEGAIVTAFVDSSLHLGEIMNDDGLSAVEKVTKFGGGIAFWGAGVGTFFAPFKYLSATKSSRSVLNSLDKVKAAHVYKPYAHSNIYNVKVTAGSEISHNMREIDKLNKIPITSNTTTEEVFKLNQIELAKENLTASIKKAVVGDSKVTKAHEPTIQVVKDMVYDSLGKPGLEEVAKTFNNGKKIELGGVPAFSSKVKRIIKENSGKIGHTIIGFGNRRFMFNEGKLFHKEDSNYLRDYDKAILHYFDNAPNLRKKKSTPEIKKLQQIGEVREGLDTFTALQESYKVYLKDKAIVQAKKIISEPHIGFADDYPELNKLFERETSGFIYGTERIKYANIENGAITELPVPHLGDVGFKGGTKSVKLKSSTVYTDRKLFKKAQDITKVSEPIEYQANRLMSSKNKINLLSINPKQLKLTPEQAYVLEDHLIDAVDKGLDNIDLSNGKSLDIPKSLEYIRRAKAEEADRLMLKEGMSADTVKNTLGVTDNFIIARGNKNIVKADDFIKSTSDLAKPKHLKITTDVDLPSMERTSADATLDSMRGSQLAFLKEVADHVTEVKLDDKFVELTLEKEVQPLGVNRMLQDAVVLANYNSLNLATASVGHVKNILAKSNLEGNILPELNRVSDIIQGSNEASGEFLAFRNWYDRQGDKFVNFSPDGKTWVNRNAAEAVQTNMKAGLPFEDAISKLTHGTDYYTINNGDVAEYVNTLQKLNREHIIGKQLTIEQSYGNRVQTNVNNLYLPPRDYPHIRYVRVLNNILDQHSAKVYRIVGATEEDLAQKVQKASLLGKEKGQDWTILTPEQLTANERFSKEYDWAGQDLNLGKAVSDAGRKGAREDLFPAMDINQLLTETTSWFSRKNDLIYAAAVEMHYADFISELDSVIRNERNMLELTTVGGRIRKQIESRIGTYEQLHAQMLGYDKAGYSPWRQMNNVVEEYGAKFGNIIKQTKYNLLGATKNEKLAFKDIVEQSKFMNEELKKAGMEIPLEKMAKDVIIANRNITEQDVREVIGGLNHIASTLMIRLDPADSIMNELGLVTKLSGEAQYIHALVKDDIVASAKVNEVYQRHFGAGMTQIEGNNYNLTSVVKAMWESGKELTTVEGKERLVRWEKAGLAVEDQKLVADMFEEARIKTYSFNDKREVSKYKEGLNNAVKKSVAYLATPHKATTAHTQYTALKFMEDIADAAGLPPAEKYQFMFKGSRNVNAISTHVTKPRLFQGAAGLAVSLYQSYAFHTASQLLKYAGESQVKPLVAYGALNYTFFGAQAVPGFNFINARLALGADEGHADLYTAAYTALPKKAADFMMYGAGGALLGSNISVRGNMTPRHMTVIPTELKDLPAVTALSNLVGAVYNNTSRLLNGDQSITQAALNTVIDSHLNRPLAGLASIALGKSVDSRHSAIIAHEETFSLASGLRIMGLKPLKEQIVTSAYWRMHEYQLQDREIKNNLSRAVKLRYEREPTFFDNPDVLRRLSDQYVKSGGHLAGFNKWLENSITKGSTSLDKRIEDQIKNYRPYAQNFEVLIR